MSRHIPPYLKLRAEEAIDPVRPDVADIACLGEFCQAFAEATGWPLRYAPEPEPSEDIDLLWSAPVNPGVGVAPGHLRIDLSGPIGEQARVEWEAAQRMAGAAAELVNELVKARHALWQREAELAAAVPVSSHADEQGQLAGRLEATLQAGAQAIGCSAAALYMLDEATSELKLRAAWGLPLSCFSMPARPLASQMADLEALLGHAVALESRSDMVGPWRSPEVADAALCVPVSSPTTPLGTLWLFSSSERKFTDEQTNIAEVVAGKISADLERTVLLQGQTALRQSAQEPLHKQVANAGRTQSYQLPAASPPLVGWQVGGWAEQRAELGGAFYDWRMLDDHSLVAMLGDACEGGIEAALASAAMRAVLRAADLAEDDLAPLLEKLNRVLWESSAGAWWGGLWLGKFDLANGKCDFATAGRPAMWWLRDDGWAPLAKPSQPLGLEPHLKRKPQRLLIAPGQSLIICNRGMIDGVDASGRPLDEAAVVDSLRRSAEASPQRLIELVRKEIDARTRLEQASDRAVLLIKRTAK